jgi:hypothetical protein
METVRAVNQYIVPDAYKIPYSAFGDYMSTDTHIGDYMSTDTKIGDYLTTDNKLGSYLTDSQVEDAGMGNMAEEGAESTFE